MSKLYRESNLDQIVDDNLLDRVNDTHELWKKFSFDDVTRLHSEVSVVRPNYTSPTGAVVVEADGDYTDETRTLVFSLPHLNAWSPHHYIRAKTMQRIVAPDSRVVVLPNNSFDDRNNYHTPMSIAELGKMHTRTLEVLDKQYKFGELALTGFSLGGLTSLAIGAAGSDRLKITHINADDVPSKLGRKERELILDTRNSTRASDIQEAVQDAEIDALNEIKSPRNVNKVAAKFVLYSANKNSRQMVKNMTGSANELIEDVIAQGIMPKVGFVDGSIVFCSGSISKKTADGADFVKYSGPGFYKHASGYNPYTHAYMVADALLGT